ncbi:MAG: DUF1326 domain-containing protein [Azospirillaceae bacterium]
MAFVDWYVEGRAFGNCTCIDGCPCQFEGRPTLGGCDGFEAIRIDRGHFGETRLDGLRTLVLYSWPGPIWEGGGQMQPIIDERADADQRAALETILTGGETADAATHWWVFRATSDTLHETLFRPIELEMDVQARRARVSIPGMVEGEGFPIYSPHSGNEHRVRIDIPAGIEYRVAEIGKGTSRAAGAFTVETRESYGQFYDLRQSPTGIPG